MEVHKLKKCFLPSNRAECLEVFHFSHFFGDTRVQHMFKKESFSFLIIDYHTCFSGNFILYDNFCNFSQHLVQWQG